MKKGCFFTVFIILTVIIAGIIYLFKNHKDEALALFKPMILEGISDEFKEALGKKNITANKDSLLSIMDGYIDLAKEKSSFRMDQMEHFFNKAKLVIDDGIIDSTELAELKNLFQEEKKYERPEEDRN